MYFIDSWACAVMCRNSIHYEKAPYGKSHLTLIRWKAPVRWKHRYAGSTSTLEAPELDSKGRVHSVHSTHFMLAITR